MEDTAKEPGVWPWPDSLDAVVAAPGSHRVVLENELTRVLEVMIAPGEREPEHTHRWPSVMVVHRPARIRYYSGDGHLEHASELVLEYHPVGARRGHDRVERVGPRPDAWLLCCVLHLIRLLPAGCFPGPGGSQSAHAAFGGLCATARGRMAIDAEVGP